jgi:hypothetical protein
MSSAAADIIQIGLERFLRLYVKEELTRWTDEYHKSSLHRSGTWDEEPGSKSTATNGSKAHSSRKTSKIWIGILAMAGNSSYGDTMIGKICLENDVPLTDDQIANVLKVPKKLWIEAKKILVREDRIDVRDDIIYVTNWNRYQSEYDRVRKYQKSPQKLQPEVTSNDTPVPTEKDTPKHHDEKEKEKEKIQRLLIGKITGNLVLKKQRNRSKSFCLFLRTKKKSSTRISLGTSRLCFGGLKIQMWIRIWFGWKCCG